MDVLPAKAGVILELDSDGDESFSAPREGGGDPNAQKQALKFL